MMKKVAVSLIAALSISAGVPALAQNGAAKPAAPAAASAAAPSAAAQASVRALLDAMHYRDVVAASNKSLGDTLPNMLRGQTEASIRNNPNLDEAARKAELAKMEKRLPDAVKAMQGVLNDPKLLDEMYNEAIPLYARYFTQQEIDQLAAFYRTPTGQKTLKVMPQLMSESMQLGQRLVAPRLQAAMKQVNQNAAAKP